MKRRQEDHPGLLTNVLSHILVTKHLTFLFFFDNKHIHVKHKKIKMVKQGCDFVDFRTCTLAESAAKEYLSGWKTKQFKSILHLNISANTIIFICEMTFWVKNIWSDSPLWQLGLQRAQVTPKKKEQGVKRILLCFLAVWLLYTVNNVCKSYLCTDYLCYDISMFYWICSRVTPKIFIIITNIKPATKTKLHNILILITN